MKDKTKNIISIGVIILFIILMIVYAVKKNNKVSTNQNEATDNSIVVENQNTNIEKNETSNNIIKNNKDKKNENTSSNTKENTDNSSNTSKDKKLKVTSSFDESAFNNGHLENHPELGEEYATLIIDKIGVNVPVIYGTTDETKGVGHDSESYFPGENSSIIINYLNNSSKLGELKNGDIIEIKTTYGDFYYKKYDEQIVINSEKTKLPTQTEKEILMIYTRYPSNTSNKTQYKYVIYAEKI